MVRAVLNGVVLAESDKTEIVEGNHYFPPNSLNKSYFSDSPTHSMCFWKGKCNYYNVRVNEKQIGDGAWYYPDPTPAAQNIKDFVAFYVSKGIKIEP